MQLSLIFSVGEGGQTDDEHPETSKVLNRIITHFD